MVYDCVVDKTNHTFKIAKPFGWEWSQREYADPWEHILTDNLQPSEEDADIELKASFGSVFVKLSDIDHTLLLPGAN